jgi:hypothetical protein
VGGLQRVFFSSPPLLKRGEPVWLGGWVVGGREGGVECVWGVVCACVWEGWVGGGGWSSGQAPTHHPHRLKCGGVGGGEGG